MFWLLSFRKSFVCPVDGTIKLLINSGRATVKTDNNGAFTFTYTATRDGENTIKANYLASENYEASETSTTFTEQKHNLT